MVAEDLAYQRLRHPKLVVLVLNQEVVDLLTDRDRDVAGQRPGGGCPHQQVVAGLIAQRELDKDAGVLRAFLVALRQLVAAERRAAARAIGHDLVALVDQPALPVLLQDPPQRFDVVVGEGDVRGRQVHPVAEPLGHLLPLLDVLEHTLPALLDEGRDAVLLDCLLAGETELLLNFELDRQTVCVPAALARDVEPAHGLVAREDVLERARQYVVDAGPAIGRRRTLVEHVARARRGLLLRLAEHVGRLPKAQDVLLHRGQVDLGVTGWNLDME